MEPRESAFRKPHWLSWASVEPLPKVCALAEEMRTRGMRRVLDLGCGSGRHTVYLAKQGLQVCALDISTEALARTCEWLVREGVSASLQQADMTALPFRDDLFDCVVSVSVLHHATMADIRTALGEARRTLCPGGLLFARECAKGDYQDGRGVEIEQGTFIAPDDADQPGVPHHFFGEEEVKALLEGFRLVELDRVEKEYTVGSGRQVLRVYWHILAETL
jgi:SAM-dependent methyltransferase